MDEPAARAFLAASAGLDVCIAYTEDRGGELVFAPEGQIVPLDRLRQRPQPRPRLDAAKLASAASLAALLSACAPHGDGEQVIRIAEDPVQTAAAPTVVIPAQQPGPEPPADPEAEPCDPKPPALQMVKKGKIKRTLGRRPHRR